MKLKNLILFVVPILFLGTKEQTETAKSIYCHNTDSLSIRESIYDNINDNKIDILRKTCKEINTSPYYLYLVINHESRFNTEALNPSTNAVGIIQFMPSTLNWMGYNTTQVYNMNVYQQLELVEQYYRPYSNYNLNHPIKLFLCTFYPFALREWTNDEYIFGSERSMSFAYKVRNLNKGFDLNNDGVICMKEYKLYHQKYILKESI